MYGLTSISLGRDVDSIDRFSAPRGFVSTSIGAQAKCSVALGTVAVHQCAGESQRLLLLLFGCSLKSNSKCLKSSKAADKTTLQFVVSSLAPRLWGERINGGRWQAFEAIAKAAVPTRDEPVAGVRCVTRLEERANYLVHQSHFEYRTSSATS